MPHPRFASEYGFQSSPSFHSLSKVTSPEDWAWDSPMLKFRNHRTGDGQQEIADQMAIHFHFPANSNDRVQELLDFIYLSQVTQAMCYRAQTEHYRRGKRLQQNTAGALYWCAPFPVGLPSKKLARVIHIGRPPLTRPQAIERYLAGIHVVFDRIRRPLEGARGRERERARAFYSREGNRNSCCTMPRSPSSRRCSCLRVASLARTTMSSTSILTLTTTVLLKARMPSPFLPSSLSLSLLLLFPFEHKDQ